MSPSENETRLNETRSAYETRGKTRLLSGRVSLNESFQTSLVKRVFPNESR